MKSTYWKEFWENRTDAEHRYGTEEFLQKEAFEKLYHIGNTGASILDFGCGVADLTAYYAQNYTLVVGVDFSPQMLEAAKKRLEKFKLTNTILIEADDKSIWEEVNQKFSVITAGQVVQYFTEQQIDEFVKNADSFLDENGKIIFFDVIDPRIHVLWELKLFTKNSVTEYEIVKRYLFLLLKRIIKKIKREPLNKKGNAFNPYTFEKIAKKYGYNYQFLCSMYYEYRYHVVLERVK